MGKVADKYLKIDPWKIIEQGFEPVHGRVSESIFSLGNEYMGVRGYFDEGYSGDKLVGCYFNGVFEEASVPPATHYKGMVNHACFMVNTLDWLYTRITIDGETLDIAKSKIQDFTRCLDLQKGVLTRTLLWNTSSGKSLKLSFERFLSMPTHGLGCQRITFEPMNFSGKVNIKTGLDFSIIHESAGKSFWLCQKKAKENDFVGILAKTNTSGHKLFSAFKINPQQKEMKLIEDGKFIGLDFVIDLKQGQKSGFDKLVTNFAEKNPDISVDDVWSKGMQMAKDSCTSFDEAYQKHTAYWADTWASSDIVIEGDPENQQGIRYCIFQMHQTYHGADPSLNIGAKGLTGEAYNGNAFWDTETYCLPFYIFNNPKAARNLLEYRYKTLSKAMERAMQLDCKGAFYPIATLDGSETCGLWQHASLQLQASTGVAYGIWHYDKLVHDKDFLFDKGIEMLIQVCRMLATRGQWGQKTGKFGYFAVMGPDEFQMMVNNNCYTNLMAKKTFEYTLAVLEEMKAASLEKLKAITEKVGLHPQELENWKQMAHKMCIPYDSVTGIYEQHDGFFNLPHIDIDTIPVEEFPLYHSWSYDRIYRNDMIKQPDVLMFMFLYNQDFLLEAKRINYMYYEPRCIHESSLSPSIHSILACEIGEKEQAYEFFNFSTRLDLDNYNRNTAEGLHLTSIAAAWVNIVYGFAGMRSDGDILSFSPTLPKQWNGFSFKLIYNDSILNVKIDDGNAKFKILKGQSQTIKIYDKQIKIDEKGITVKLQK